MFLSGIHCSGHKLELKTCLCFQTFASFSGPPSQLELRSSGGAGEYVGGKLGLFQLLPGGGEGGAQGPVYQQRHNTNNQQQYFLYRWENNCTTTKHLLQTFSMLQKSADYDWIKHLCLLNL